MTACLLIGLAAALSLTVSPKKSSGQQTPRTLETEYRKVVQVSYLLSLPKGYEEDEHKRWPLLLFLHGAGESGSDLNRVKLHGPPKLIEQGKDLPFIVVSPQTVSRDVAWQVDDLIALLDDLERNFRIDKDREYVTGLSMGGMGTWALALAQPGRFAAIAPICGASVGWFAPRLSGTAVWIFHGLKDTVIDPSESQRMYDALKGAGVEVKLTLYPDAGHDSWTEAYNNPELFEWLLAHSKGRRGAKRS